jgi:glycosyltransferase involved in cell wall biosynthesis
MSRIYLDVTSACQSGLNTGVKRMQRGLHAWLAQRKNYHPVYWQAALRDYRILNPPDFRNLEQPFATEMRGVALYDAFVTGLLSDWVGVWRDRSRRLAWPQDLRAGDLLLVPDLLWDNRGVFFHRPCAPKVCRIGIFHDAIALRRRRQSRIDAYFCGRGVRALAHFDQVVCVSREAEADLHFFWKKFGEKPVPTHVVPWPVPFAQKRPESRSNFEAREILCVARLEPHKNHLRLLDACDELWGEGLEFKLRLIGCKAYPDAVWRILRRVKALQSAGRDVLWRAHVTEDALHTAYRSSSFTVFPSLLEGFGLPIIESIWHGRPVVCGTNGALGEVAAGGGCETVEMNETGSLVAGLRRLLTDQARYEQLCRGARERECRCWEQYWNHLLAVTGHRST